VPAALASRAVAFALAAVVACSPSAPALAAPRPPPPPTQQQQQHSTIRVEDVASPAMRAGLLAANEGRLPEAERFFRTVLAGRDEGLKAAAASNLGNVLLQAGRTAEALAQLDAAVALAPGAAVPLLNRSLALEQLAVDAAGPGGGTLRGPGGEPPGQPAAQAFLAAALADASAACDADPGEAAAFYDAGGILQRLGRMADALAAFSRAADVAPGLVGYRLRVGALQFETGDAAGAARTIRGVTRKAPTYVEAHAAAAAVAYAAGDGAGAEGELERALSLEEGWKDLAHVQAATRWPPRLVDAYARLLRLEGPA
jgi:tetratricopeptide (TPR) repeat protein